jgi:hypothetical protein
MQLYLIDNDLGNIDEKESRDIDCDALAKWEAKYSKAMTLVGVGLSNTCIYIC